MSDVAASGDRGSVNGPRGSISLSAAHTGLSDFAEGLASRAMLERRARHLGIGLLFYDEPLHLVRGEGATVWDADGRSYLDCYNNVPSVGHCNEHVVGAMARQASTHTTHTRYLDEVVLDYVERLTATLPPGLDRCVLVNSGTEANDLALQMAFAVTGRAGVAVMEHGYHGNSELVRSVSLMGLAPEERADHVVGLEPPYPPSGHADDVSDPAASVAVDVAAAADQLDRRGHGLAALVCDGIFDSQGGLDAPTGWFAEAYRSTRAAGGLCIADEVQPGFGRTGTMWGFEHDGVVPDIVTFGKPAGNGYPLAGVVTTAEIADAFAAGRIYFNTFGGSPVAAAVGAAVLDEIDRLRLLEHVRSVGEHLAARLDELANRHGVVAEVRGRGLYRGIVLVDGEGRPNRDLAARLPNELRRRGVLLGSTGRYGNVLKVRPPLVVAAAELDTMVDRLDEALIDATG